MNARVDDRRRPESSLVSWARVRMLLGALAVLGLAPADTAVAASRFSPEQASTLSRLGHGGTLVFPGVALLVMGLLYWLRGRDERRLCPATDFAGAVDQGGFIPSAVQDMRTPSSIQDTPSAFGTGATALQAEPPRGVRPALMAVLSDEDVRLAAIAATMVDLAIRGYLHIDRFTSETGVPLALLPGLTPGSAARYRSQDPKTGLSRLATKLFVGNGWMLTMTEPPPDAEPLLAYEQVLLHGIFANYVHRPAGAPPGLHFTWAHNMEVPTPSNTYSVALGTLRTTFAPTAGSVRSEMYSEVVSRGWFRSSPRTVHRVWYGLAWALLLGGAGMFVSWTIPTVATVMDAWSTFATSSGAAPAVGVMLAGLVVGAFGRVMPARTASGAALYVQAKAFRRYLQAGQPAQVGLQQQFEMFRAFLPYAMALGVEKHWIGAFSQLINASDGTGRTRCTPGHSGISDYSELSTFAKEVGQFVEIATNSSTDGTSS